MQEEDFFQALLKEHTVQQVIKSCPSRILQVEGLLKASHRKIPGRDRLRVKTGDKDAEREMHDTANKEVRDKLYSIFSQFGQVAYVNEHLLNTEDLCLVFYNRLQDAQKAKETLEKDVPKYFQGFFNETDINWRALRVLYDEPKTPDVPLNMQHKSSRHLWVGSIDDRVITSSILEAVFSSFGELTDRPHINVGRQQGFVDFHTVHEAVDAMCHLTGAILGCMPLEIRFGRQEYGKVLWIGGFDETVTERALWEASSEFGTVKGIIFYPDRTAAVTFNTAEEAQVALDVLQGARIGSCMLRVDYFRTVRSYGAPELGPITRRDVYYPGDRTRAGRSDPNSTDKDKKDKEKEKERERTGHTGRSISPSRIKRSTSQDLQTDGRRSISRSRENISVSSSGSSFAEERKRSQDGRPNPWPSPGRTPAAGGDARTGSPADVDEPSDGLPPHHHFVPEGWLWEALYGKGPSPSAKHPQQLSPASFKKQKTQDRLPPSSTRDDPKALGSARNGNGQAVW